MKACQSLPEGYREIYTVNLQKDKKTALLVNTLAVLIGLAMGIPMHFAVPITTLFDFSQGPLYIWIRYGVMMLAVVVYMILHELVHGVAMKLCGTKHVKYGFTGLYAFAGSDDYYDKYSYITIALAPVVVWGIVIAVVNVFVPTSWFWVVYILQISNISGAAGDFFVTIKFLRFPRDILVKDIGVGMTVYSAK